ncbi:pseudouridine synthase [Streptococcus pluranimalium]|uniref:pseudouridine synthase n=1 Tax=Streptococcus hyovaginalis TaxID=149015 RepID=UPI002A916B38|nr:pseudouridine synthase [Streptococcus hyovaginalis]MDY5974806.1 pseudouridine synthase [Streptococcus hyovaginalis]
MRMDELLKKQGFGSRNQIKKLLKSHQVKIDGKLVTGANTIVDAQVQKIEVAGQRVRDSSLVYYLLHKPAGIVTARKDGQHQTVLDLLAKEVSKDGLYPVGRLDRDTEGLVLITNNGPLGFKLLHPSHHISKTYLVEVNGYLAEDAVDFFDQGVRFLDGNICKPAQLDILNAEETKSRARLVITEGKFHQVKKMFLAYGLKVTYLKRIAFGPLKLGDLERGQYRPLAKDEIAILLDQTRA